MANIEKAFRNFVRANFKARMARNENGEFVTQVKGKTAKTVIQNFDTVMANLSERCKLVSENNKQAVFQFQASKKEGGVRATITVAHVGNNDVLTVVAANEDSAVWTH